MTQQGALEAGTDARPSGVGGGESTGDPTAGRLTSAICAALLGAAVVYAGLMFLLAGITVAVVAGLTDAGWPVEAAVWMSSTAIGALAVLAGWGAVRKAARGLSRS